MYNCCHCWHLLLQLSIEEASYHSLVEMQESTSYPGLLTQASKRNIGQHHMPRLASMLLQQAPGSDVNISSWK